MSINILVVEDDIEIAKIIGDHLKRCGYGITWASTGQEGWDDFKSKNYNLVIVDLMLPEMDGFTLVKHIRLESDVPVIILSAKHEDDDKVKGLNDGADDYLTKPFSLRELEARIESHLRRYQRFNDQVNLPATSILSFHPELHIDVENKIVKLNDKEIFLTAKEYAMLMLLTQHPQRTFSKKELYEHVWNQADVEGNNTVTVHIKSLRTKIEDPIRNPDYIQTVWGIGYRFVGKAIQ